MQENALPFHSFKFSLIEGRLPRRSIQISNAGDGMYDLRIEKGSSANPTSRVARKIPCETARALKDALQGIGVFSWAESYPDAPDAPARRWTLGVVFKEGVFAVSSKGGSAVPAGFESMLEELYRLDFPRPAERAAGPSAGVAGPGRLSGSRGLASAMGSLGIGSIGGLSAGDIGAYGAAGKGGPGDLDFSKLGELFAQGEASDFLSDMQRDPEAMQKRMKEEFRSMSPSEQDAMLDALAATGLASRAWWERFFRG